MDNSKNSSGGIVELRASGSTQGKKAVAEKRTSASRLFKFFKVADQCEAEALFLNSGPAEADYGKNSGCPPLQLISKNQETDIELQQCTPEV